PTAPSPLRPAARAYAYRGLPASRFALPWRAATALDLAAEVKTLLDVDYPDAEQVVLVWDNLNTHTPASLYKAFPPAEARRLLNR
ncbi:MAG: Transposase, partial [Olavius algarvensis Gamma 1 endosymbiont]